MNILLAQIKFRLLAPGSQVVRLNEAGIAGESDDVLFPVSKLGASSVFDQLHFPKRLQADLGQLPEGGIIRRHGVWVALPGHEGIFDLAFTRESGSLYWLIVDRNQAWPGSPAERWQPEPPPDTAHSTSGQVRILLAEDNPFNQKVALRQLARLGYEAEAVGNGKEALAALTERHYDLVLMDLNMPVMNGYDAFRQIRSTLPTPLSGIPVVAMSSSGLSADDPGFDAVLKKPAHSELLKQTIIGLVFRRKAVNAETSQPTIRLDYLREITQANRDLMVELMDIYLNEVPIALAEMQSLSQAERWRALRELAHKTKANFRYVGADQMFRLTDTIERYAASGGMVGQIPDLLAKLVAYSEPTAAALRRKRDEIARTGRPNSPH